MLFFQFAIHILLIPYSQFLKSMVTIAAIHGGKRISSAFNFSLFTMNGYNFDV